MSIITIPSNDETSLTPQQRGQWSTPSDGTASITITNSSGNRLMIGIGNVPSDLEAKLNGLVQSSPNGIFNIPGNSPNFDFQISGNFQGKTVTVANLTNAKKPATAEVSTVTL